MFDSCATTDDWEMTGIFVDGVASLTVALWLLEFKFGEHKVKVKLDE